jgi:hypothetical protein
MNTKVLSSLTAALVVTSFVPPAIAEPMGDHPAVVVARTWNHRGIDPNTFILAPPASTQWISEAPKTADEVSHANESPKLNWSAAIGTGHAAGTIETSNANPTVASTRSSGPHWTASIGTGTAASSRSAVPNTNAPVSSGTQPIVAATDWTSRIGSGHPFASASPVKYTSVANNR